MGLGRFGRWWGFALLVWSAALLSAGCGEAPHAVSAPRGVDLALRISAPAPSYAIQAIAHRWQASDVFQYEVTLEQWDGSRFVDLASPVVVVLPQKGIVKQDARFTNLRQGVRYQAIVRAMGNPGGTAPDVHLNAMTPCTAVFDLTAGQDVDDALVRSLQVLLDPVAFSGELTVSAKRVPGQASTLQVDLLDADTGTVRYTSTYPKNKVMTLSNLRTGIRYVVRLTAIRSNGNVVATAQSDEVLFDPAGQDLEQSRTVNVSF